MGKDLKGKECGKEICQRKDGLYSARYTVDGKKKTKERNNYGSGNRSLGNELKRDCDKSLCISD